MAATLLKHEPLLLNWFESQGLSSGVVEGFNNKARPQNLWVEKLDIAPQQRVGFFALLKKQAFLLRLATFSQSRNVSERILAK